MSSAALVWFSITLDNNYLKKRKKIVTLIVKVRTHGNILIRRVV